MYELLCDKTQCLVLDHRRDTELNSKSPFVSDERKLVVILDTVTPPMLRSERPSRD